jgi:hypothetical protein
MDVANNLAVALLQADEAATMWQRQQGRAQGLYPAGRPAYVADGDRWGLLAKSASFWTACGVTQDLGPPPVADSGFPPLDHWWSGVDPYLGSDADWLTQHARLLSDFGDHYISPWAQNLVSSQGFRKVRAKGDGRAQTRASRPAAA